MSKMFAHQSGRRPALRLRIRLPGIINGLDGAACVHRKISTHNQEHSDLVVCPDADRSTLLCYSAVVALTKENETIWTSQHDDDTETCFMSWRFRKTFRVLPGIKLNLTARGLSATLGAAPFSVNVGPRGVYRNVSIPGTGIWDRQRIGGPSPQSPGPESLADQDGAASFPVTLPEPPPSTAIHSASTELLGSESMAHLRKLLKDAYEERETLTNEISAAAFDANKATSRHRRWERGFLMKRLFKQSFAVRKETAETAVAKLEELAGTASIDHNRNGHHTGPGTG